MTKHSLVAIFAVFAFAGTRVFAPPASLTPSTSFVPADGIRDYIDVAGTWNGTADVSATAGDRFEFTLANGSGVDPAYDLAYTVTLPANFNYVSGTAGVTATGVGCGSAPGVSAVQGGSTLTFSLTPAGYDLPADCSLKFRYGLVAGTAVVGGTYSIQNNYNYSLTNGGGLVGVTSESRNVLVKEGATLLTVTPSTQTKAVAQNATLTLSACNTGLGGLYDVTLSNAYSSLSAVSFTQTAPAAPTATGNLNTLTLGYLAPGDCFTATSVSTVTNCTAIEDAVTSVNRSHPTAETALGSVTLDFNAPLIAYTPPSVNVPYSGPATVSFNVDNTGLGSAFTVVLDSNLNSIPVTVSNVAAGWTYNSSNGSFTRSGGTIANAATLPLSFDLEQTTCQPINAGYTVLWNSSYADGCTNPYTVPSVVQSVSIGGGVPLSISKSGPVRVNLSETGTWNLTVTPNDLNQLHDNNTVVTDNLPSNVAAINVGTAPAGTNYSCPGGCGPGKVLTWTVPKAALAGGAITLPIGFTTTSNTCSAGTFFTNSASATNSWGPVSPVCPFTTSASSSVYIAQTPGFTSTQSYNLNDGAAGGLAFETGANDNGNGIRDLNLGEGEFLAYTNIYEFDTLQAGTWAGSTYRDDFGGLAGQALVPGSMMVALGNNAAVPVPGGSISYTSGVAGDVIIDLAFLADPTYFSDPNVANHKVTFTYKTTVTDGDLPLPGDSRSVVGTSRFTLNNGGNGCAGIGNVTFTQPLLYRIYRAKAGLSFSMPNTVDICQTFAVTATVNPKEHDGLGTPPGSWNSLVTQSTSGNYDYLTGQTPAYGGAFSSGVITYAENGGTNPTFTLDGSPVQQSSTAPSLTTCG